MKAIKASTTNINEELIISIKDEFDSAINTFMETLDNNFISCRERCLHKSGLFFKSYIIYPFFIPKVFGISDKMILTEEYFADNNFPKINKDNAVANLADKYAQNDETKWIQFTNISSVLDSKKVYNSNNNAGGSTFSYFRYPATVPNILLKDDIEINIDTMEYETINFYLLNTSALAITYFTSYIKKQFPNIDDNNQYFNETKMKKLLNTEKTTFSKTTLNKMMIILCSIISLDDNDDTFYKGLFKDLFELWFETYPVDVLQRKYFIS